MTWLLVLAAVVAAYLLGSLNFAVIFSGLFLKTDVRNLGSGNAGTTNMMRNAGFWPGALTFLGDVLKGAAACLIGKWIFSLPQIAANSGGFWLPIVGAYLCGLVCMIGHVFPAFFQFKGGKGVAVSVGIFAVCCPIAIVLGLLVFAVCVLTTRLVSLSSLIATVTVVSLSIVFHSGGSRWICAIFSILMGITIFLKHTANIKRLYHHTESKITIRKR